MRRRSVIDGKLVCSRCRTPKPVSSFTVDSSSYSGYGYQCRRCRRRRNKIKLVSVDSVVVPVASMPVYSNGLTKTEPGTWDRFVLSLRLLRPDEIRFIPCVSHYQRHHSIEMAIREAARRAGIRVRFNHSEEGVYVQ